MTMRLLVEYSHPAQVHKFKYVLKHLIDNGHQVLILSRKKDVMLELLEDLSLPHICISNAGSGLCSMALELMVREFRALYQALRFKPDLILSAHSVAITHIGWLLRIPRIVHDDTEHATLQQKLYMPFATRIITSSTYLKDWGKRQVRINSLEPLAYLHPDHFTPDPGVLLRYGLTPQTAYIVIRFIAWQAAHDIGYHKQKQHKQEEIIKRFLDAGAEKIVLSCEGSDNLSFQDNIIRFRPEDLHHLLAFARLCLTEGGSVANEAAVLGVPTILLNPLETGIFLELKRYRLLTQVATRAEALKIGLELWNDPEVVERWQQARKKLLHDKENMARAVTKFLLSFAEEH